VRATRSRPEPSFSSTVFPLAETVATKLRQRQTESAVRGVAAYILAGLVVVLAMDAFAPPAGLGLALGVWPRVERSDGVQTVNRRDKGDRLDLMKIQLGRERELERKPPQPEPTAMPEGCELVVSALSPVARADNVAHRCLASGGAPYLIG
jgi:hypothetical protein